MSFFDDFLGDLQSSAEESFSNFTNNAVGSFFEQTGFLVTGEEKQENAAGINQGNIQQRPIPNAGIQKNSPWPQTMASVKGISPFIIIGGAILAALLLRRR